VVQRFGVGLVIERSLVRLPAGALSSQLGQLGITPPPTGVGKSSTSLHGCGYRQVAFICVGCQVTLCDPIWQVTSRSPEVGIPNEELYRPLPFIGLLVMLVLGLDLRGLASTDMSLSLFNLRKLLKTLPFHWHMYGTFVTFFAINLRL